MTTPRADFPDHDDGEVLFQLASRGVELSLKREIEFSCYARDRQQADEIVKDLESYGYRSSVFEDDGPNGSGTISVYSAITMLPAYELLILEQKRLNLILAPYGATCDGWGTRS